MSKSLEHKKAILLRKKGMSIGDIAKSTGASKGSVSVWCRDIVLTQKQIQKIKQKSIERGHVGRQMGADMNRRKKEEKIASLKREALTEIQSVSERELFLSGLCLYWAEGSKKSKLGFSNSDPKMILCVYHWFQRCFRVKKEDFMPRLFVNESHTDRIDDILNFWSNLLELPIVQFGNPIILRHAQKKYYTEREGYHGVLTLGVRKSTHLKYRIIQLIEVFSQRILSG